MKKLLFQIIFVMLLIPAITQAAVYVTGTITDSANNAPIPNHAVYISADSSNGFVYFNTVYTNPSGIYYDSIPVPNGSSGAIFIQTLDCNSVLHQATINYTPTNLYFTQDFQICNSTSPCQANFSYYLSGTLTVQFIDYSSGGNGPWDWNFGDGGTSTVQNPAHTYSNPGQYTVTLAYGDPNSSCYDTKSMTIYLNDSTGGGCNAAFTYIPDSVNNPPYMYQFLDQSTGNIISWYWNFDDPASGVNNYSTVQNPVHAFSSEGIYNVCLTIQGADSSCYDVTCNAVIAGNNTGCQANFTYYPDSSNLSLIQFIDQSIGNIYSWSWNFGDPGSGSSNVSSLQNPVHYFTSPGTYTVCLIIQGGNSGTTCYDTICQTIVVGNSTGCQADFTYYTDSTNTSMIHFIDQSMGNIISWTWNFGDGSPVGYGHNPTHIYPAPGTYEVCLTVQGADSSCYDMTCKAVIVGNSTGCQANFTYNINPATGNYTVYFTDLSTGNPTAWFWTFGSGYTSTLQNPSFTFPGPGTYPVCLTITSNNCSSTFCDDVVIQDSLNYHQVYGQVFEGNFPLEMGVALIFSLDSNLNYNPYVDVCSIDSNGIYYFTMVPDGNYLVYAIPLDYNGYLPTYYGDVLNWEQATVIELGEPGNPYNIHLIQSGYMPQGPGSVSGLINMGSLRSTVIDKMIMLLMDKDGNAIYYGKVSESGSFEFPALEYGTYYLHAELSGITSDNVQVVLSPEKPHADVIMTFEGKNVLGIKNMNQGIDAGTVYPNPIVDRFNIPLNLKKGMTLRFEIFNQTGQLIACSSRSSGSGQSLVTIPVSGIDPGVYTLKISSDQGKVITRKLIIAK